MNFESLCDFNYCINNIITKYFPFKVRRMIVSITVFVLITVVLWVYMSSNPQFNNKTFSRRVYNYFTKSFIIEPDSKICARNPFIIILVTSYVGHVELRSAHRRAMPLDYLKALNATRVFLLAKIPKNEKYITQEAILDESKIFGDIVQGSFIEHYRNLTHKHLMGLHWASTTCSQSSFILKVDDDIVFSLNRTHELLSKVVANKNQFLMGYVLSNTVPKRNKHNKWYVTQEEFSRTIYPPYLSGWYYIISPKLANKLTQEAIYHPYFWIDDIFITGILREIVGVELNSLPKDYWLVYYELLECCIKDMIAKLIRCDYVVGPNGGRNNLIVEFTDAQEHCKIKNCTTRSTYQTLNKVCVTFKERSIFGDGQAVIENLYL